MTERIVYADNAATTKVSPQVAQEMMPYFSEKYGNPSSIYKSGQAARDAVETSRQTVAKILGAAGNEIYFTGCGTESNNWAIKGAARLMLKKGKNHIITTKFEHHAVLHPCAALEKEGFRITYLDVHKNGIVIPAELERAITPDTGLVSVIYANNEIGTIQPISEIGSICRKHNILFHTDAVQAVGHIKIDVAAENIDLLSLSGHKLHAPKGIGALYIRKGIVLPNLLDGGAQEMNRRAGTENVPYIVALAKAMEIASSTRKKREAHLRSIKDYLLGEVLKIDRTRLNGDHERSLPGIMSFCFEGIEGESLLLSLDFKGIYASSGSACTSGSLDPSHVLLALGLHHEIAHGSLRLSFSEETTLEDAQYIACVLPDIVNKLRSWSPLWDAIINKGHKPGDKLGTEVDH